MELLALIKKLTNEQDEDIINFYISKACEMVNNHLGGNLTEELIISNYQGCIVDLVCLDCNLKGKQGLSSETQGQRVKSYKDINYTDILVKFLGSKKCRIKLL